MKSCSSVRKSSGFCSLSSPQQVSVPLWQVGPSGLAWTSSVSLSQSILMLTKFRKLPLVSPFVQRQLRERLQKVTFFVSIVLSNASWFM